MDVTSENRCGGFPRLLVIDLDGTSLGGYEPYGRFPDAYSAFLDRLDAAGCRWAINSTWDVQGQLHLLKASRIRSQPMYLMTDYGFRLWELGVNGPERVEPYCLEMEARLAGRSAAGLQSLLRELVVRFTLETVNYNGHWLTVHAVTAEAAAFERFMGEQDWASRGLKLYAHKGTRASIVPDFLGKQVNLAEVLRRAGLTPGVVVVAGDERADLAMMQSSLAQYWICPANADEGVKAQVLAGNGEVGARCYSDGVMDAFGALAKKCGWPPVADVAGGSVPREDCWS